MATPLISMRERWLECWENEHTAPVLSSKDVVVAADLLYLRSTSQALAAGLVNVCVKPWPRKDCPWVFKLVQAHVVSCDMLYSCELVTRAQGQSLPLHCYTNYLQYSTGHPGILAFACIKSSLSPWQDVLPLCGEVPRSWLEFRGRTYVKYLPRETACGSLAMICTPVESILIGFGPRSEKMMSGYRAAWATSVSGRAKTRAARSSQ